VGRRGGGAGPRGETLPAWAALGDAFGARRGCRFTYWFRSITAIGRAGSLFRFDKQGPRPHHCSGLGRGEKAHLHEGPLSFWFFFFLRKKKNAPRRGGGEAGKHPGPCT
jgi:hypothetical protein